MIVSRYLSKEIFHTLLASTVILLLIFICGQLLSYLRNAASTGLDFNSILLLLFLQIPVLLTILLPLSLFIGIILAYSRLYSDNEMIVLFSCGMSTIKLFRIAFRFALFMALIIAILTLWLAPKMEEITTRIITANQSEALQLLVPGRFNSIAGNKWVFYVESITSDHKRLKNVFVAQEPAVENIPNANHPLGVVFSDSGYQHTDKLGNKYLILTNGSRYIGSPGHRDFQIIKFKEYGTRLDRTAVKLHPDERTFMTKTLLKSSSQPSSAAELSWRLSLPISCLILAFLAVPLSKVNPRYGRYSALVPASILYIIYINLLFLARTWVAKGEISLGIGMWWVHMVMIFITAIIIIQTISYKRIKTLLLP